MVGRSIRDRMSYRNHYICSGEATSKYYIDTFDIFCLVLYNENVCLIIVLYNVEISS